MTSDVNQESKRVWASLITHEEYLPGLLTLDYSLQLAGSKYPLLALYTDTVPETVLAALDARKIARRKVPLLKPSGSKEFKNDARFMDTWTKLSAFSLVDFDRVVLLDSDMLVRRNLDELMILDLDPPSLGGDGQRVFAASHACCCNPLKKEHYPPDWIPSNCAFTMQHQTPEKAQIEGPPISSGLGMLNGGLLVINPSMGTYSKITKAIDIPELTCKYDFPDQDLLADIFTGRWVALPYTYNALKTLRWKNVHDTIWRDDEVKVVHYIFADKPWKNQPASLRGSESTGMRQAWEESNAILYSWWWDVNKKRQRAEQDRGILDNF
ncbi:CAZyme family GT8 [Paecilomyces variotii]|nr:CAZyme family GT8 [Paecilomyces variotii]KAJ9237029.1 CAZyme family GT8 [Paecilomyces variotii]KAJ9238792.1 CAZyme family GT8 [Paecilomyces variotii]KAJ9253502.1 CAZyme family GT8 [Paecilomyces variotii]KAJ9258629.1 CAZyme family GT8 [Paecilomyces variotii]